MSTIKFHTRHPARALAFTTALIVTTACHPASRLPSNDSAPAFEIKQISPSKFHATESDDKDDALAAACAKWQLTKEQARHFFQLSQTYKDSPYSEFYQLPCSIDGIIEAEGKTWEFTINAGATAVWRSDNEVRYFGCSDPACEPLVLMMPDGMNP